jgi:hypothetical protein
MQTGKHTNTGHGQASLNGCMSMIGHAAATACSAMSALNRAKLLSIVASTHLSPNMCKLPDPQTYGTNALAGCLCAHLYSSVCALHTSSKSFGAEVSAAIPAAAAPRPCPTLCRSRPLCCCSSAGTSVGDIEAGCAAPGAAPAVAMPDCGAVLRPAQLPAREPAPRGAKLLPDMLAVKPPAPGAAPNADAAAAVGLVKGSAPTPDIEFMDRRGGKLLRFDRGAPDRGPDAVPASPGCCLSAWCSFMLSMLSPSCADP